jgi:hypothetical protein
MANCICMSGMGVSGPGFAAAGAFFAAFAGFAFAGFAFAGFAFAGFAFAGFADALDFVAFFVAMGSPRAGEVTARGERRHRSPCRADGYQ